MDQKLADHREFLNRYYGASRHIYDLTRKYFLFGRDSLLDEVAYEGFSTLVEVGPGTGRNLRKLRKVRPEVTFGGLEASDEMLAHAREVCPWAHFRQGFAEHADLSLVLGEPPERILYSYCLSMVGDPELALRNSVEALAPRGVVVLVDFGDFSGAPPLLTQAFRGFLAKYHVRPLTEEFFRKLERDPTLHVTHTYGPMRYFVHARFARRTAVGG